jgi:hypothetical protein
VALRSVGFPIGVLLGHGGPVANEFFKPRWWWIWFQEGQNSRWYAKKYLALKMMKFTI